MYNEEINPSWGGPIIRDRLWFFSSVRFRKRYTAIAGTYGPTVRSCGRRYPISSGTRHLRGLGA